RGASGRPRRVRRPRRRPRALTKPAARLVRRSGMRMSRRARAATAAVVGLALLSPLVTTGAASARAPRPCDTDPEPVAADRVPTDIAAETSGRPGIGDRALWTVHSALTVPPVYDVEATELFLKFPWMRREPGALTIT